MKVYTGEEMLQSKGRMILEYGRTTVGKSATTLLTAPAPILLIQAENRNLEPTLDVVRQFRPSLLQNKGWLDIAVYEGFADTMAFLNKEEARIAPYRTIVVDSLTDLMAIKLSQEIQDEVFDSKTESEKEKKQLISPAKLTLEGYGGLSAQTVRFTDTIARYAKTGGKYVILLVRLDQNPSWARYYEFAPLLKGKEYGKDFEGMFDLIGFVTTRTEIIRDENGNDTGAEKVIYPPGISFESADGSYMAKWTGVGEQKRFKLNWSRILNAPLDPEEGYMDQFTAGSSAPAAAAPAAAAKKSTKKEGKTAEK